MADSPLPFGSMVVIENRLTIGPDVESKRIGKAQGFYLSATQRPAPPCSSTKVTLSTANNHRVHERRSVHQMFMLAVSRSITTKVMPQSNTMFTSTIIPPPPPPPLPLINMLTRVLTS
ncbi:Plant disease resistance response protein [Vigna unguiculata]|uniref:Dirigent protein n=1 Tax=Vigna unguiculata TaxID=3917 RepID=A0A4D6M8F4_VIGUN|nr:Plant disease resistance response protein [Vigna unguiculata]